MLFGIHAPPLTICAYALADAPLPSSRARNAGALLLTLLPALFFDEPPDRLVDFRGGDDGERCGEHDAPLPGRKEHDAERVAHGCERAPGAD